MGERKSNYQDVDLDNENIPEYMKEFKRKGYETVDDLNFIELLQPYIYEIKYQMGKLFKK